MKIKYPKTYHLPWSESITNDDKVMPDIKALIGTNVVVLEKRDGENFTMARDYCHARSLDSKDHYTRHMVKSIYYRVKYNIPDHIRICGENLHYAKSIKYNDLNDYFEVFSIWETERCLSWYDTLEICSKLNLRTVPIIYIGEFKIDIIKMLKPDTSKVEGYVVRPIDSFNFSDFHKLVGKYVRKNHVQTDDHWMHRTDLEKNSLRDNQLILSAFIL